MFGFSISDVFTVVFVLVTLAFCFWWYFLDFNPILKRLKSPINVLPQQGNLSINELSMLLKDSALEAPFKKYQRTLIQDPNFKTYTLSESQHYFSLSILLGSENIRRWQNYANIMLGLGILGTFFGLALGLMDFNLETSETIQKSIQTLVPGMKTAFWTSVVGMFTSLIANFVPKFQFRPLNQKLEGFCKLLDENFLLSSDRELQLFYTFQNDFGQRIYPAQFMQNIMRDSSEQTRGIKRFTEDLAEGIILSAETMDLLADKIAGALERPMTQYMLPALQDVQKAVEELRDEKQESIQEFIAGVSSQFTESMENVADKFESALTNSLREKLAGLAQSVSDAGSSFARLPSLIETQIDNVRETMGELSTQLRNDLHAQQLVVADTSEKVSQNLSEVIENQTSHFQNIIKLLVNELGDAIGLQQKTIDELSQKLRVEFSLLIAQESEHLESVIVRISNQLNQDIATQQEAIGNFSKDISEQTQRASIALREVLSQIESQQMAGAKVLQEVMSSTHEMLNTLSSSVENISGAMGNIEETMKDLKNLSGHLGTAASSLTNTSQTLSTMTQSFLTQSDQLSNRNQELLVQILSTMKEATTMTQVYVDQFSTIKTGLVKIFADIDQGLKNYRDESRETLNRYLGDFSDHLSDAARTLSVTVSSMKQLVEDIEEVHQHLPGSVQSIEQLTQRLLKASNGLPESFERFDDVRAGLEKLILQLPARNEL